VQSQMEEFKTVSAQKYFQNKKEKMIGSFEEARKKSSVLIKEAENHLKKLEKLFSKDFLKQENLFNISHFHLFATLRALSIVKNLSFPEKVYGYMKDLSRKSLVNLSTPVF